MGSWIYKGKIINDINDFKPETFGFIYVTTHIPTGKKYLGKKEEFTREIIQLVNNKKLLTYFECKHLFNLDVLESDNWLNSNILGKFFKKDFTI